ncbi:hypothetical protein [Roseovarius sp. SYSU LYC5161]|uniref:hypothetical protein n=1 Tax=Roseovarius halophilus (ex Wu et al. 2025) TaxID=3376060 RepID=UPI00399C169C
MKHDVTIYRDPRAIRARYSGLAAHYTRRAHTMADAGRMADAEDNGARAAHYAAMAATMGEEAAQ